MSDVSLKAKERTPEEKLTQNKKKELRELKNRMKQLRETAKAANASRKEIEVRVSALSAELGIAPREKQPKPDAG